MLPYPMAMFNLVGYMKKKAWITLGDNHMRINKSGAKHFIFQSQKGEQGDMKRVHNSAQMGTGKSQSLAYAEDLSIPSFQVIVMDANMGCGSCRDRVFRVLSRMTGFKECSVDVRKKQVVIKGDVRFLWSGQEED